MTRETRPSASGSFGASFCIASIAAVIRGWLTAIGTVAALSVVDEGGPEVDGGAACIARDDGGPAPRSVCDAGGMIDWLVFPSDSMNWTRTRTASSFWSAPVLPTSDS